MDVADFQDAHRARIAGQDLPTRRYYHDALGQVADDGTIAFFAFRQALLHPFFVDGQRDQVDRVQYLVFFSFTGSAGQRVVHRKSTQYGLEGGGHRHRPARAQAMLQRDISVIPPQRIVRDVFDEYRAVVKNGGSARTRIRSHRHIYDRLPVLFGQGGCGAWQQMFVIRIEQHH